LQELPRYLPQGKEVILIKVGCLRLRWWAAFLIAASISPCTALLGDTISQGSEPATVRPQSSSATPNSADAEISRGKYLADAGNCISCHTQPGAMPFTGGVRFETPFGTLFSSNITPDPLTGIGAWKADDLRRAMHEGVAVGGHRLFPAFPYPSFTKVTDADIDAIYAYMRSVKAVSYTPPSSSFVFSQRWGMASWNALFFSEGRFKPDAMQSAEWNRGAYLVEGLGHCGACHTPRNLLMAEKSDKGYSGGSLQDEVVPGKSRRWSAVNLTSAKSGLNAWSVNDLAKYLQTGFSARGGTFGPMNAVIVNSTKKLTAEDVRAMAVYLKSLPAQEANNDGVTPEQVSAGAAIYKDRCEKCHATSGRGGMFSGPPLAGSAVVQAEDPASLINVILYGPETPVDVVFGSWERMQPYMNVLNDSEVAAVSNYIRGSWGNRAAAVKAAEVAQQR
jgi:mono/diheme cytochrome c family protein